MTSQQPSKKLPTRIIAIDFGMARLGVAMSDESKLIAMPLTTIKAEPKANATVAKLLQTLEEHSKINNYTIEEIVIGLPLLMSGKHGLLADEVQHFTTLLKEQCSTPIMLWDERLTSVQAERSLREGDHLSRKKRAQRVDSVAATLILQNYLDFRRLQAQL